MKLLLSFLEIEDQIKGEDERNTQEKNTGLNCFSLSSKLSIKIKSGDEKKYT
jgi:hypothetical protein